MVIVATSPPILLTVRAIDHDLSALEIHANYLCNHV